MKIPRKYRSTRRQPVSLDLQRVELPHRFGSRDGIAEPALKISCRYNKKVATVSSDEQPPMEVIL